MKLQFAAIAMLVASVIALASVNIANAQWDALGSGYAITTDYHGKDVLIGQMVTATAAWAPDLAPGNKGSTPVTQIEFVWHAPDGTVIWDDFVPISGPLVTPDDLPPSPIAPEIADWANKNPGITYYYAQDARIPSIIGDWGVQAIFHDTVRVLGKNSDTVAIHSTSFNAVPEVPYGTIAIMLSWFGVLGVFALRKKRFHQPTPT